MSKLALGGTDLSDKDFYLGADQVSNIYRGTTELFSSYVYPLDEVTGAQIGVSLRKLSSTYTGNCLSICDVSQNNVTNVGFTGNFINETTVTDFYASYGTAYLYEWFDQSGNTYDFTSQTTGVDQRVIVYDGAWQEIDGKKSIRNKSFQLNFNGVTTGFTTPNDHALFYVTTPGIADGFQSATNKYVMSGTGGGSTPALISNYGPKYEQFYNGSSAQPPGERNTLGNPTDSNLHLLTINRDYTANSEVKGYFDGSLAYTDTTIGSLGSNKMKALGSTSSTFSNRTNHYISEFIFYNDVLSAADLATVNDSITTYWGL